MPVTPTIKIIDHQKYIFCLVRRKWILLTPEEKVRQFTIQQLVDYFEFPLKYISVEKTLKVLGLSKRYDIVVYNQQLQPKILIECKAEDIAIDQKTLQQIATYNIKLQVPFLMVTNGKNSFYFEIKDDKSTQINNLPKFDNL